MGSQTVLGSVQTDGEATSVAVDGDLAYVINTEDIAVVNVSDPANPLVVTTFGGTDINHGGLNLVRLDGNNLVVASVNISDINSFNLLVYSLANPTSPRLLSNTKIPYALPDDLVVEGNTAFVPMFGTTNDGNGKITDQYGEFLAVDLSNPAAPRLAGVLFNDRPAPEGGNSNQFNAVPINSQVTYVAGSTSTGSNTESGSGSVLVVNTANPASMSVAGRLDIPGTVMALAIAVNGNEALVVGTTGGWQSPFSDPSQYGPTGKITLTMLNISDPLNPRIIGSTVVTQDTYPDEGLNAWGKLMAVYLGNGQFAVSNTQAGAVPVILVVNASDPGNLVTNTVAAPADINGMAVSGDRLLTASGAGLGIYAIGALTNQAVTAEVTVPTTGAAVVVASSFSVQPWQIIPGSGTETLVWDLTLAPGAAAQQITWETTLNGLASGQVVAVATGASIQLGNQQFTLPASKVAGIPETQSIEIPVDVAAPGVSAIASAGVAAGQIGNTNLADQLNDLSVALTSLVQNPTSAVYLSESLAAITSIVSQVANDPFLVSFAGGFSIASKALATATTPAEIDTALTSLGTALASLATTLTDEGAHKFTMSLLPEFALAQPRAATTFQVDLTNNGSAATTYDLSVSGLPAGVSASFNQTPVTLQSGQSISGGANGITLSLSETGDSLVPANFTVTVTAEGAPEITLGAPGQLTLPNESILVAGVVTNPPFTNAGGQVDVTAKIQTALNEPKQIQVSFTVADSSGKPLFSSRPVTVALSILSSLTTVDLGNLDTTGFADGIDTITVTVTDASGNPISGATGQATLTVGSPVTATITVTPTTLPTGTDPVTNTLVVSHVAPIPSPLSLEGAVATTAPETSVALYGNYAYESGQGGVNIIDVSEPSNPKLVGTFAQNVIVKGSLGFNVDKVVNGKLIVATQNTVNSNLFNLLIYSLASPLSPQLVSNTTVNYRFMSDLLVNSTGTAAYATLNGVYAIGGIFDGQSGDFLSLDLSNPSKPQLADVLFNNQGPPNGSNHNEHGGVLVNDNLAYVASTTSTGGSAHSGTGRLLIVNTSDPAQLSEVGYLDIPGTVQLEDVAISGKVALVVGNTGGWNTSTFPPPGFSGNVTLTLLDISNPDAPTIIGSTVVTPETLGGTVVSLSNGEFLVSGTQLKGQPVVVLVDPSNPNNLVVGATVVPSTLNGMTVSGNTLYATTDQGLSIYNVGPMAETHVTVSVEVPNNTGVSIVANSFNVPPSQTIIGTDYDTLVWTETLAALESSFTVTWNTTVSNLGSGETRDVTLGTSVAFTDQGTPGSVSLPAASVTGEPIIELIPSSQTIQPGGTATYDVRLTNPTNSQVMYGILEQDKNAGAFLSVGLNQNRARQIDVTVGAEGTLDVSLAITTSSTASPGDDMFTVNAKSLSTGALGAAQAVLTLAGTPLVPVQSDLDAYAAVATLTPSQAIAGRGTSASFIVQLTNTGNTEEKFNPAVSGLPSGVSASFPGGIAVDVQPGASNFMDQALTLAISSGTAPGTYPFTVAYTSHTDENIPFTATAEGTLIVVANGVERALEPVIGQSRRDVRCVRDQHRDREGYV